jgi:hypothetical protein
MLGGEDSGASRQLGCTRRERCANVKRTKASGGGGAPFGSMIAPNFKSFGKTW